MRNKDSVYMEYAFIKGKMAEAIARRLFDALGMHVCHYGYEFIAPSLMFLGRKDELSGDALKSLRKHADFLVCDLSKKDQKTRKLYKIEVKYRNGGSIKFSELLKYDRDVYFMFLDNNDFRVASYNDIEELYESGCQSFSLNKMNLLEDYAEFDFSDDQKAIIQAFKKFLHITFGLLPRHNDGVKSVRDGSEAIWRKLDNKNSRDRHPEIQEYDNSEEGIDIVDNERAIVVQINNNDKKKPKKNWPLITKINSLRKKQKAN